MPKPAAIPNEKQLETIFERVVRRVLASSHYDISLSKELKWLEEGEATVKNKKRYGNAKSLMKDLLR